MSTVVLTMNERGATVGGKPPPTPATAKVDLERGLRVTSPDLVFLQEWVTARDTITDQVCKDFGYAWKRPSRGGEPVMWDTNRYRLRACFPVLLSRAEIVGHLPGRKNRLGANYATCAVLDDLHLDTTVVGLNYHLTADVQDVRGGGGYKKELAYRLRVMRHKREKRRLGRAMRAQERKGRKPIAAGDSNFAGMTLGGFVNCWAGHKGGSLGGRPVDIVFAAGTPIGPPRLLHTHSDHLAVAVTYP